MYTPQVFLDSKRHCLLYLRETDQNVEYVQHQGSKVDVLRMEKQAFYRNCTRDTSVGVPSFVNTLNGTVKTGCALTPAARFALQQVSNSIPKEGTVPKVPTSLANKEATKKTAQAEQEPLPFDTAKVVSSPVSKNLDSKASSVDPDNGVHPTPSGPVKTVAVAPKAGNGKPAAAAPAKKAVPPVKKMTVAQAAAAETPAEPEAAEPEAAPEVNAKAEPEQGATTISTAAQEAAMILETTQTECQKLLDEANAALAEAQKVAEDKKVMDKAKAEADKLLKATKAQVAKIMAQVKALKTGSKKPRAKKGEKAEGERGTRARVDVTGHKIKQITPPVFRKNAFGEDSSRGLLLMAIYNSKTTDEALEYQGATGSLIQSLVTKGFIELVPVK